MNHVDQYLLLKTANFAADKHRNQKRKNAEQTPYINHPIGVAFLLSEVGKVRETETLQAGLLHDTLEDTNTTYAELKLHFGNRVADIVSEVTDDKSLSKDERKRKQIEHASHLSVPARTVKLADKLHNLTSLLTDAPVGWDKSRIQGYFVWAHKVIEGLRGTNVHLEEELDKVFASNCYYDVKNDFPMCFLALPPEPDRAALLEQYLNQMAITKN